MWPLSPALGGHPAVPLAQGSTPVPIRETSSITALCLHTSLHRLEMQIRVLKCTGVEGRGLKEEKAQDTGVGRRYTSPSSWVSVSHIHTCCAARLHFVRHTCSPISKVLFFFSVNSLHPVKSAFSFLIFSFPKSTSLGLTRR